MSDDRKIVVRCGRVRLRPEFLSGEALGRMAEQLASKVPGFEPTSAARFLRRLGRRSSA